MKVTVRSKPIANGRESLYLDFYPPIIHPTTNKATRREFLSLQVVTKPTNAIDREHNKETRQLANNIAAKRQLDIQANDYGFLKKKEAAADFLAFFKELAENHKSLSRGDKNNWQSVHNYLCQFTNGRCSAKEVTPEFCESFKAYLQTTKPAVAAKKTLANNSAVGYFNIFKRAVKQAFKSGLVSENAAIDVSSIKKKETQREFLSLDEIQLLAKTPCDLPMLKRAALFSALTGLRYSDIDKLTWEEVTGSEKDGYSLRFTQKKTEGVETLPISEDAVKLIGPRGDNWEKVFPNMLYSAWQNQKLQDWVYRAGIYRKITFHCFRHTFATLQLTLGTDIYTVSKLLGHRSVSTTQVYGKVIDEKKREAANRIKLEFEG